MFLNWERIKVSDVLYGLSSVLLTAICCSGMSFLMPFRIYMIGLFGICMYGWAILKQKNIVLHPFGLAMVLFTIMVLVGIPSSLNKTETIKYGGIYLCMLPLVIFEMEEEWMIKTVRYFKNTTLFIASTIIINSVIPDLFLTKLNFLIRPNLQEWLKVEVASGFYSGIAGEKGEAAMLMVLGTALGLGQIVKEGRLTLKNTAYMIITLVALMLPAKRTLFAIGCFFLVVYVLGWTRLDKKAIAIAAGIFLVIGIVTFSEYIPGANVLMERFTETAEDTSLNGRSYLWERAWQMFENKPFTGYGYGSYNTFASYYGVRTSATGEWAFHAHNIYLQLLAEMGILGFGLIVFCFLLGVFLLVKLHLCRKRLNVESLSMLIYTECMLICYILYGLTGNSLYSSNQLALFMVVLAYTVYLHRKNFPKYKKYYYEE